MPQQLIYTSIKQGLDVGRSGYCTVARTKGMRRALEIELEALSHFDFKKGASKRILSFRTVSIGNERYYVCTNTNDCGFDYTGRTNFICHHVVFSSNELSQFGVPADFLANWRGWNTSWHEAARELSPDEFAPFAPTRFGKGEWARISKSKQAMPIDSSMRYLFNGIDENVFLKLLSESENISGYNAWETTFTTRLQAEEPPRSYNVILKDNSDSSRFVRGFEDFYPQRYIYEPPKDQEEISEDISGKSAELGVPEVQLKEVEEQSSAPETIFPKRSKIDAGGIIIALSSVFSIVLAVGIYFLLSEPDAYENTDVHISIENIPDQPPKVLDEAPKPIEPPKGSQKKIEIPAPSASLQGEKLVDEKPAKEAAAVESKPVPVSEGVKKLKEIFGFTASQYADINEILVVIKGEDGVVSFDDTFCDKSKLKAEIENQLKNGSPFGNFLKLIPVKVDNLKIGLLFIALNSDTNLSLPIWDFYNAGNLGIKDEITSALRLPVGVEIAADDIIDSPKFVIPIWRLIKESRNPQGELLDWLKGKKALLQQLITLQNATKHEVRKPRIPATYEGFKEICGEKLKSKLAKVEESDKIDFESLIIREKDRDGTFHEYKTNSNTFLGRIIDVFGQIVKKYKKPPAKSYEELKEQIADISKNYPMLTRKAELSSKFKEFKSKWNELNQKYGSSKIKLCLDSQIRAIDPDKITTIDDFKSTVEKMEKLMGEYKKVNPLLLETVDKKVKDNEKKKNIKKGIENLEINLKNIYSIDDPWIKHYKLVFEVADKLIEEERISAEYDTLVKKFKEDSSKRDELYNELTQFFGNNFDAKVAADEISKIGSIADVNGRVKIKFIVK